MKLRYTGQLPKINIDIKAYKELVHISKKITAAVAIIPYGKIVGGVFEINSFVIPKQLSTYLMPSLDEDNIAELFADISKELNKPLGLCIINEPNSKAPAPTDDTIGTPSETKLFEEFVELIIAKIEYNNVLFMTHRPEVGLKCAVNDPFSDVFFDNVTWSQTFVIDGVEGVDDALQSNVKPKYPPYNAGATYGNGYGGSPQNIPLKEPKTKAEIVKDNPTFDKLG